MGGFSHNPSKTTTTTTTTMNKKGDIHTLDKQTDTKVCVQCLVSGQKTQIKTHIGFKTDSHARLGTQSREIETKLIVVTTFLSAMAMVN